MIKQIFQLIIMMFMTVAVPQASAASLDDLQSAAGKIHSINARFIQEKHMKILVKPLISTGIFIYQAPDSVRFEYHTPIRNVLLMQDKTVNRYIQQGDALIRDNSSAVGSMQVVMDEITRWMKGDFNTTAFDATVISDPDISDPDPGKIVLTPKDKALAKFIQTIEMGLSSHPGVFRNVTIYEDSDSFTRLLFEDVEINAPVNPSVFKIAQ